MKNTKNTKKHMTLKELLIRKTNALYDIEHQLVKALPKLVKAATDQKLKEALREHLAETRTHVTRLEQAHDLLGVKPKKLVVDAIRGIAKDAEWVTKNTPGTEALDSAIVRSAQYAEHYEIGGYRGAIAWAETLGENKVASLLKETLLEEEGGDEKLAALGKTLDQKLMEPIEPI